MNADPNHATAPVASAPLPAARHGWNSPWLGWGVFGGALAIRSVHVACLSDTALIRNPTIDPAAYLARANEILGGKFFPDDVFFQDPLYPYLLAAMSALTDGWRLGPYLVHAVLGAVNCVWLLMLGRRFGSARAGAIAGVIASLYGPFLYLDGMLEKNVFTIFFLLASLVAFPRPGDGRWRWVALSGLLMGCGALLRGNLLLVVPVAALILTLDRLKWDHLTWKPSSSGLTRALASGALFVAAALAPIAPFTTHNYRKSGDFILTTAQAGTAFYLGNNPENVSGGIHHISFNRQIPEFEADDWKREAERRTGKSLTRKQVSAFWFRAAADHVTKTPGYGWWFGLLAKKAELVVNHLEVPDNTTIQYAEKHSPLVQWTPSRFATVAPFGLLGILILTLGRPRPRILFAVMGVYVASLLLFPVSDRFRAPFAALLILTAGISIDALWRSLDEGRHRSLVKSGASWLLAFGLCVAIVNHPLWLQPANTNLRAENAKLKTAHDEAEAWIQAREWGRALAVLEEARRDPWLATKARLALDLAVVKWHGFQDLTSARELVSKSVKAFLESGESAPDGYRLYAELCEAQGKPDVAAYWRGRFDGATRADVNDLTEVARRLTSEGDEPRASGIVEELVFLDRARPATEVPREAYLLLSRLQLVRGDRARAAETVKSLQARGGAIPEDLTPLLER